MELLSEILEVIMVVSFGISWPLNIIKAYKSRTAKGKSLLFLCFIFFGYICGISSKITHSINAEVGLSYVVVFYIINLIMVGLDLILYARNSKLDKLAALK